MNENASRLYAYCLLLYEESENHDGLVYLPKCLSIISRHPFFNTFKQFLAFLYTTYISNSLDETESIERILDNFIFEVPMSNSPNTQVIFKIGSELHKLSTNPFLIDFPLDPLFHALSPEKILKILGWICTERIVIFVSNNPYLLSVIVQSFLWLLQPIKWCTPCIAIIPPGMELLLQSPTPILVGFYGSDVKLQFPKNDEIVAVYLDDDEIEMNPQKDPYPIPTRISEPIRRFLNELIYKFGASYKHPSLSQLGNSFSYSNTKVPIPGYDQKEYTTITPIPPPKNTLDPIKVKGSIMIMLREIIGDYYKFLSNGCDPMNLSNNKFCVEKYINSKDPKERPFFVKFTKTQMCAQYGKWLFDQYSPEKYLRDIIEKMQPGKIPLIQMENIITQSVTAPDPDYCMGKKSMLIKHVLNKNETFPAKLNNSLFLNNQSIPWEIVKFTYEEEFYTSIPHKINPLASIIDFQEILKLNFAKSFVEYVKKNDLKANRFWEIAKIHKSSQPNSGSRSLSSRSNNKPRSVNANTTPGIIDTSDICPFCKESHSLWEIRQKMFNNKELSISCKKCNKPFIPHFAIHPSHYNDKFKINRQQEYLNPCILLAVIEECQKTAGQILDNSYFFQYCPVIFWNLLIFFSDTKWELNCRNDGETHAYNIHEFMIKEDDELLHDSESLSEPKENRVTIPHKIANHVRWPTNINVSTFLIEHTDKAPKGNSIYSKFEKGAEKHTSRDFHQHSISNTSKLAAVIHTKDPPNIYISHKTLKLIAKEMTKNSEILSQKRSLDSMGIEKMYSTISSVVPSSRQEQIMPVYTIINNNLSGFTTQRKPKEELKITIPAEESKEGKANLQVTQKLKKKGKGTWLIRGLIKRLNVGNEFKKQGQNTKRSYAAATPCTEDFYDKCIKRQLCQNNEMVQETGRLQEKFNENIEEEKKIDEGIKKEKIATNLLCKAMEILLKNVSFANSKELVEVQNYAICNKLLEKDK